MIRLAPRSLLFPYPVLYRALTSLDRASGTPRWVVPVADAVHWGNPVTSANGVVYTVDLKGFIDAYDAGTGAPRSEEHTSELQSRQHLVCRLLLEKITKPIDR